MLTQCATYQSSITTVCASKKQTNHTLASVSILLRSKTTCLHNNKTQTQEMFAQQKFFGIIARQLQHATTIQKRFKYSDKVIDHYKNPRNIGSLDKAKRSVGTGVVGAPACGDVMKMQIEVDDKGVIIDAKFKTFGCGSAIASSSLATEMVLGKTVDQVLEIKNKDIAQHLSLPPVKLHCSMLAEDAIKAAVYDYKMKKDQEKQEVKM